MNLALFAASLKTPKNIMAPICVWREETSLYLFAGERRYLTHFFMGASHALTRVWHEKPNRFEMKILEWQENHEREDLSIFEKLTNMRQILEEWGKIHPEEKMTVRRFAHLASIGRSQAGVWLKIAKCENIDLNSALKAGRFSGIEPAYELSGMDSKKVKEILSSHADHLITKEDIFAEKR